MEQMVMRILSTCFILFLLSFATPATAEDVQSPVQGGAGGTYLEYSCGPGRVLVGLHGSAGVPARSSFHLGS